MAHRSESAVQAARELVARVAATVAAATNETQLRHEVENALEAACRVLDIPWTPYQVDRTLRKSGKQRRFVDVAHGALIIEYEPPRSFVGREGATLAHAKAQAEEYALLLAEEEGRALDRYLVVAWDGAHISFGRSGGAVFDWDRLSVFDAVAARQLLDALRSDGVPLVHPKLLAQLTGPESSFGAALIPRFFTALRCAREAPRTSKTKLLFAEWRRLFGQAVGIQSEGLRQLLAKQGAVHEQAYDADPDSYLFALHTYIALLAKVVAACALPDSEQDIRDRRVAIGNRVAALESGVMFEHAGISNMLSGDFFSWYIDDPDWPRFADAVDGLVNRLAGVSFDVSKKSSASTRDLFKGIYESFVPRPLRHALGEFYTPDWLAEHAIDTVGWQTRNSLLDPTCGSGTFVLEALRRRLADGRPRSASALLQGLHGFDLNPLAVLSAKASMAVYVAPYLDRLAPVRLPFYLADAVNPAIVDVDGSFAHVLQTEIGPRSFRLPHRLVVDADFFRLFGRVRQLVDDDLSAATIVASIESEWPALGLDSGERNVFASTVGVLCELHERSWNGIWCPIVADRFAAGAIGSVEFICGNPPWVKWSHLPPEYARFIGPRCRRLGVFSSDRWVGGIESDMSTVITFEVIDNHLASGGRLAFFITGTVFSNESSEGFRQFRLHDGALTCRVLAVEDYDAIAPFDGVSNRPALLILERGGTTSFPVPYRKWSARSGLRRTAPQTYRFLRHFKTELENRSSFKRFQARAGHPFYSLWSTGPYTFAPFKVLWREMGGGGFAAAYVGSIDDPLLGSKLVIPDHKLYFIPVDTVEEAAYLTGLLNSPLVSNAVAAYASQLSLGASVAEYLSLPPFKRNDGTHAALARLAQKITDSAVPPSDDERCALDDMAHRLFDRR